MNKTTVLANMRFAMSFNDKTQLWFHEMAQYDFWFARDRGNLFFREFRGHWRKLLSETIASEIENYFRAFGVSGDYMPHVELGDDYPGSWIVDAAITISGPVGTAYAVLKGVSELPKIAEGLSSLSETISTKLGPLFNNNVGTLLRETFDNNITQLNLGQRSSPITRVQTPSIPPPPPNPVDIVFTIDARPLRAITPAALKSHSLHLSVAVSRDSFVAENLGKDAMNDVRIGIFRTPQERNQWSYVDSFTGIIPLLSGGQTTTKQMSEFRSQGIGLDFSDGDAAYIDCWVQDNYGIYLFRFFLDKE